MLSTIHTNDAPSAVTRLVDMGVEPYLVASSLVAVLAQRLVRVLCTDCREAYYPTPEALAEVGIKANGPVEAYRAVGCPRCHQTGYRGRLGIFELMVLDDELREYVSQSIDAKTIKRAAVKRGMSTLRADGARKVVEGLTSIDEVLRTSEDEGVSAGAL